MKLIRHYWEHKPLLLLLFAGGFLRIIAALFSKGYGMHDDHFLVIEAAQSFVDGYDYNNWLPSSSPDAKPTGHSWFYVGIHYGILSLLDTIGISGPQAKMYIIRILHAFYSLLIVSFSFKITQRISNLNNAKMVGLLLATYWVFPILSVRNLVEVVCLPPLMIATYMLVKKEQIRLLTFFIAGLIAGLAVGIRFQTIMFIGGFGLALWIQRKWVAGILFGIAAAISFSITQIGDIIIWGAPFQELTEYINYNLEHKTTYFSRPWYMYLGTVAGVLVPPISVFFMFGFTRSIKKHLIIFLPAFIFFAFHSYFPNKQERFIFPAIPFIIILGYIGWNEYSQQAKFWLNKAKFISGSWKFFWGINTLLLLIFTGAYSKKSRVEAMTYLNEQADFQNMIIESSHKSDFLMPPLYYLDNWQPYYHTTNQEPAELLRDNLSQLPKEKKPNYVVFMDDVDRDERIKRFTTGYGKEIVLQAEIAPSHIDALLHWLNPAGNDNQTAYIYKIKE